MEPVAEDEDEAEAEAESRRRGRRRVDARARDRLADARAGCRRGRGRPRSRRRAPNLPSSARSAPHRRRDRPRQPRRRHGAGPRPHHAACLRLRRPRLPPSSPIRWSTRPCSNGLSVCRVDAGSGRPSAAPGLTDLCAEQASFGDVVHRVRDGLAEVPWGELPRPGPPFHAPADPDRGAEPTSTRS